MIKEHIEKLPGGKEFIVAQNCIGIIVGATAMFIASAVSGLMGYSEAGAMLSRDSALFMLLVLSGFGWIILLVFSMILYFYLTNQADNIYYTTNRR